MRRTKLAGKVLCIWALLDRSGCVTVGPGVSGRKTSRPSRKGPHASPKTAGTTFSWRGRSRSADRCDEAVISARRGRALLPEDPTGPILIGECLEKSGDYDAALNLYAQFLFDAWRTPGAQAVEGRRVVALRLKARQAARVSDPGRGKPGSRRAGNRWSPAVHRGWRLGLPCALPGPGPHADHRPRTLASLSSGGTGPARRPPPGDGVGSLNASIRPPPPGPDASCGPHGWSWER